MHDAHKQIAYVGNIRFPTEKAHGLQIAQVASALGKLRAVRLIVPAQQHVANPFSYYGIEETFAITRISSPRLSRFGPLGHALENILFLCLAARRVPDDAAVYSRELFAPLFFKDVTLELHYLPSRFTRLAAYALRRARTIIVKTDALRDDVTALTGRADILVLANAVDAERFNPPVTQAAARQALGILHKDPIALYCGSLQSWKGVDTFIAAAALLPRMRALVIGGTEAEHRTLRAKFPGTKVEFISHRPHDQIPLYLRAADALILPNTATEVISTRYTSPLKLLEYLASGTPVVASALPTILSTAAEDALWPFAPDNPKALAEVITEAMSNPTEAAARASRGQAIASGRSWTAYAATVSALIP